MIAQLEISKKAFKSTILCYQKVFLHSFGVAKKFDFRGFLAQKWGSAPMDLALSCSNIS